MLTPDGSAGPAALPCHEPAARAEMGALEESASRDMLLAFLQSGVAVHNADLSWEERDIIERYARRGTSASSAPSTGRRWTGTS